MKLTKTALVAEIVGLVVAAAVIERLSTVFLGTNAFWPLMILAGIYLCIRGVALARKNRRASTASPR